MMRSVTTALRGARAALQAASSWYGPYMRACVSIDSDDVSLEPSAASETFRAARTVRPRTHL